MNGAISLAAVVGAAALLAAAPAHADDERPGGLLHPSGSLLYATGVAEFGLLLGRGPGVGGVATGFHYAERGGLLANVIAAAGPGIGAQAQANATGRTVTYHQPSPDDFGSMGLTVDAYSRSLGGDVAGIGVDLFAIIKIGEHLPWSIDLGTTFQYVARDDDATMTTVDAAGFGLYLGVLAPVTRFAQVEVRGRGMIGGYPYVVDAGGLVHLSDRFYVRGSYALARGASGPMLGLGGRL
ncbi:MAG: hypothetical protein H6709_13190 [Kofleriaceae bacterium]|nr:hypothetical protein [Myxococcales bacterium]MCB9573032.1 hypothetical protein [Kofleriaceae bacterium]